MFGAGFYKILGSFINFRKDEEEEGREGRKEGTKHDVFSFLVAADVGHVLTCPCMEFSAAEC
jgi:hypothetical protein